MRRWNVVGAKAAAALMSALLCLPFLAQAEKILLVGSGEIAQATSLELINLAHEELLISRHYFYNDISSMIALAAIVSAARRGAKVKMVVDGFYNYIPPAMRVYLTSLGIEIRDYHPIKLRKLLDFKWMLGRMHDKLVAVDGKFAMIGGRNVGDDYFAVGQGTVTKFDREVLTDSARVTGELREYFLDLWDSPHVMPMRLPSVSALDLEKAKQQMEVMVNLVSKLKIVEDVQSEFLHRTLEVPDEKLRFVHDIPGRKCGTSCVEDEIVAMIEGAEDSIVIETPYLVLTKRMKKALQAAQDRAARKGRTFAVTIFTNSMHSTDQKLPQAAYEFEKTRLVEAGMRVYELKGPQMLHGKSVVVDKRKSFVGSFNMNSRSAFWDLETGIIIDDQAFAEALLTHSSQELLPLSTALTRESRSAKCSNMLQFGAWALRSFI